MNLTPLVLDSALDAWERQPKESTARHGQFVTYRDLGRTRTLRKASEGLALSAGHLRAVAAAFRWRDRVEAWDRHRDLLDDAAWREARTTAAKNDARLLDATAARVARRLADIDFSTVANRDLVRLLDVTLRHRRLLYGDPTATLGVTGPTGDPLTVQIAEFSTLPPEVRRARLNDLAESVLRRNRALADEDDDDDIGPDDTEAAHQP